MLFFWTLQALNVLSLTTAGHCWDINQKHKPEYGPKEALPFHSPCRQELFEHQHVQLYSLNNRK